MWDHSLATGCTMIRNKTAYIHKESSTNNSDELEKTPAQGFQINHMQTHSW